MRVPSALIDGEKLAKSTVELVSWPSPGVVVSNRKISWLRSELPPVRSRLEKKAIRVPAALIDGAKLPTRNPLPVESVSWVNAGVVVSDKKISLLRSEFPSVRSPSDSKAIRVPVEFIDGRWLPSPLAVLV